MRERSDFIRLLKEKMAEYEAGQITLSTVLSDLEFLAFEIGGEHLFSEIDGVLSAIEDINARSAETNYKLSAAESEELESLFEKLEEKLRSLQTQ